MQNPLLTQDILPAFSSILPEHIEPALKKIIHENREQILAILSQQDFTWDNLMQPLEDMNDRLSKVWSPVAHLHAVMQSEALREVYGICQIILTEYHTELMQNEKLFQAIQSIANSNTFQQLPAPQRKVIENELRDFKLAGVHLPPADKVRFADMQKQLNQLMTQFSDNVLDATQGWFLHITDADALFGLPEQTIKIAQQNARDRNKTGWVFTLDYPCYSSVMKYLVSRELRWLMYEAYVTRASDQGPEAGHWDNTMIMENILQIRHAMAELLGFKNFAEYSLATKMAKKPEDVLNFLTHLVQKAKPAAEIEIQELTALAKKDGIERLEAWDIPYYTEKLRQQHYALSQEELRPFFPAAKVIAGMFAVIQQLFGITLVERLDVNTWHPQVQFFEIYDEKNELRGYFYTDLYARPHKRDGAWMDDCAVRRMRADGSIQQPIAFLTCNFERPLDNHPALLRHDDVITLFHEFGHCLHHLLTQVDCASVAGINGVPWDAVEFPSQFLEHWCWEKEALHLISGHVDTGEPLPDLLFNKMLAAKNFQPGMHMLRQLEFALFDFRLHLEYNPENGEQVQTVLDNVRKEVCVIPVSTFNRFQHSFSHIFSGGYAAGYYSYEWADVLASDAFSKFEEHGIFDKKTGRDFLHHVLEQGGVKHPMDLFVAFRGREPKIEALLKHKGLHSL